MDIKKRKSSDRVAGVTAHEEEETGAPAKKGAELIGFLSRRFATTTGSVDDAPQPLPPKPQQATPRETIMSGVRENQRRSGLLAQNSSPPRRSGLIAQNSSYPPLITDPEFRYPPIMSGVRENGHRSGLTPKVMSVSRERQRQVRRAVAAERCWLLRNRGVDPWRYRGVDPYDSVAL